MFKIRNKEAKFPELYPKVERKLATTKDKGWDKVGDFILREGVDLIPQVGLQENLCACESNLIFVCGQATSGKAQPYDAKVLTPNGFVDMGSLQVGDTISGIDGDTQNVLAIFEQGEKDVFKVTFDDGANTECCAEHLWSVYVKTSHNPYSDSKVIQFSDVIDIFDSGKRIAIPLTSPQKFGYNGCLPIDPYVLGLMIGDGHIRKYEAFISTSDSEIINSIECVGYRTHKTTGKYDYRVSGNNLMRYFRELGLSQKLSYEKFIPEIYKYANIDTRLSVLQGLMDADGTVDKLGHISYCTTSEQLAKDVQFMIRSLGGRCKVTTKKTKFTHKGVKKDGRLSYLLYINTPHNKQLCRLTRKRELLFDGFRKGKANLLRKMIGYKYIGKKQCRCILVSNQDSLYITDDFIVTHNTFGMMLKGLNGVGRERYTGRLINVRLNDSKKGTSMFRDGMTVWGNFSNCEVSSSDSPTFAWSKWNNAIQMIHANFNPDNPQEWDAFQEYIKKQQSSYIAIDEATAIERFKMFAYIFSRNRDDSGVTPSMVLSFNPKYEHWTTEWLVYGGYIGADWKIRPEMDGVTRYFYIEGDSPDKVVWGNSKAEVAEIAHISLNKDDIEAGMTKEDMVKSFTLFTGNASGNRKLVAATKGQSVANLHNVGAKQRAVLAEAYFGPIESEEISVTKRMINDMFDGAWDGDENMYAVMDVSGGDTESDDCPMCIFKGNMWIGLKTYRGTPKDLVPWIEARLQEYNVPITNFAFDATGIGYFLKSFTNGNGFAANRRPIQEYDEYGNQVTLEQCFNLRSQFLNRLKVMLEKGELACSLDPNMVIPYGKKGKTRTLRDILYDEMNVFIFTTKNGKIYAKSKDEYKAKFHCSPNLMDSLMHIVYFHLDARPKKQPLPQIPDDAYNGLGRHFSGREKRIYI